MDILLDFDGTCTTHDFPRVGHDIGAQPVLRKLVERGHRLILFTMRSNLITYGEICEGLCPDFEGQFLNDAIRWFIKNDIPLYGVQRHPDQISWTESPKAYGQLIIDDTALGCPLVRPLNKRPYVDWIKVEELLTKRGIL